MTREKAMDAIIAIWLTHQSDRCAYAKEIQESDRELFEILKAIGATDEYLKGTELFADML